MNALEYFKTHLKYEKDPRVVEAISKKFTEYLRRAEEIRALLDGGAVASGGDAAAATARPKTQLKDKEADRQNMESQLSGVKALSFKEQAIEYVKQAVEEDNAGNYAKAFPLYMNALEYFKTHLKYETHPKIIEAITLKFNEYLRRAEEIRAILDDGSAPPKTKLNDGEGSGKAEGNSK
ncbi:hypothetical protein M8C21_009533 [Ambrosia artemisiifolia]|uniref:MIT domain-containing protein n=1 Tax=Ambrosia artemisiifolia TaxID=4212 RepID=A0AAD5BVX8_AMBAR|nr:hypothetical protein M8C21_009533 [Ambrosia artemisiifolia]